MHKIMITPAKQRKSSVITNVAYQFVRRTLLERRLQAIPLVILKKNGVAPEFNIAQLAADALQIGILPDADQVSLSKIILLIL
jgi:hypothetical protein